MKPAISSSVRCSRSLASRPRRRTSMARKMPAPLAVGWTDHDTPVIVPASTALHEAAVLHAADDAGRARDRDAERVGEVAHRQGAAHLELRDDVQMDQGERAERSAVPALDGRDPFARVPGGQLVEQVGRHPVMGVRRRRRGSLDVDIQWHIYKVPERRRVCNTAHGDGVSGVSPPRGWAGRFAASGGRSVLLQAGGRLQPAGAGPVGWTRKIQMSQVTWLTMSAPMGMPAA